MRILFLLIFILLIPFLVVSQSASKAWIRINQLGYSQESSKVAVFVSKEKNLIPKFELINSKSAQPVLTGEVGQDFGAYGPFVSSYRLDFSACKTIGTYYLKVGDIKSPEFTLSGNAYTGTADFALRYMRQQRSGYNPFLKDSCHTKDGYTV